MSYSAFEDAVYAVLKLAVPSIEAVVGYQNGPELPTPYCVVYAASLDATGREETGTTATALGDGYEIRTLEHYLGTARFEFTGKDIAGNHGGDIAVAFTTALATPNIQLELRKKNLGYMSKSLIRRVPKLRETAWYNAYVIDVVFSFALETKQQVAVIENVVLDSTYNSITTIVDSQTIPNP